VSPEPDPGSIVDVPGVRVGHYTNLAAATGCTVVLLPEGAVGGADVRGTAPGTRETDLLRPTMLGPAVNAFLLTGGSAFGLDAASGVMRYLDEHGVGFQTGAALVPIIPAAVLYDLAIGDATTRPDATSGYAACTVASPERPAEGTVGAGTGATVGKLLGGERATKGGLGTASVRLPSGNVVGAIVAVNALGDVVDPHSGAIIAGARSDTAFADSESLLLSTSTAGPGWRGARAGENTTIAVVVTSAQAGREAVTKIAQMANDALARAIRPSHLMQDGDVVFAAATGTGPAEDVNVLGVAAARALTRAIVRAVSQATGLAGVPSAWELPFGPLGSGAPTP
jgi:L-aminopeptidase/D-esterase-like protein